MYVWHTLHWYSNKRAGPWHISRSYIQCFSGFMYFIYPHFQGCFIGTYCSIASQITMPDLSCTGLYQNTTRHSNAPTMCMDCGMCFIRGRLLNKIPGHEKRRNQGQVGSIGLFIFIWWMMRGHYIAEILAVSWVAQLVLLQEVIFFWLILLLRSVLTYS